MKQLKDEKFLEYTIKIRRVREVFGEKGIKAYKNKMFLVDIIENVGQTSFAVPMTRNYPASINKVFKMIKEELYLI